MSTEPIHNQNRPDPGPTDTTSTPDSTEATTPIDESTSTSTDDTPLDEHPPSMDEAVAQSHTILANQSRSFTWASRFLPPDRRDDAAVVYAFCRTVDDAVDEVPDIQDEASGNQSPSPERARQRLDKLRRELDGHDTPRAVVRAFLDVADRRDIDLDSARELIDGCAQDLEVVRLEDDRQLLRYCYRVAGTVGLMMSSVLGVSDARARHHAIDLGVAMQLTNICRDVLEDARRGRVYLPGDRLRDAGASQIALVRAVRSDRTDRQSVRHAVSSVVDDLLELAEDYYRSADRGMHFIPARSRPAILVASRVYRAIGLRLRRRGCDPLDGRTVVSTPSKMYWVLAGLFAFVSTFYRSRDPAKLPHDSTLHDKLSGLPGTN